jgi:hypothetical protein
MERLLVLGAGVTLAIVLAALLLTDGNDDGAAPPEAQTTVAMDACTAPDDVCNKAAALHQAVLVRQDYDWVTQNYAAPGFIVCNTDDPYFAPRPEQAHLCEGAGPSETRRVYHVGPDGGIMPADGFEEALRAWVESDAAAAGDSYGAPGPRLYSVGCPDSPSRPACSDGFKLVFSKLPAGADTRSQLILAIGVGNEATISGYIGPMPEGAWLEPALRGGIVHGFMGPQGRATTFYALN